MTRSMTAGSPAKLILLFALPLFIGNLFQQVYNMADTFIVGRMLGVNALAAVGCTGSLMFLIIGFAQGLSAGFSILTAQRFGAGDADGVRQSYAASLILGGVISVVLTAASVAGTRQLLVLLQTPPEILEDATRYLMVGVRGHSCHHAVQRGVQRAARFGRQQDPAVFSGGRLPAQHRAGRTAHPVYPAGGDGRGRGHRDCPAAGRSRLRGLHSQGLPLFAAASFGLEAQPP